MMRGERQGPRLCVPPSRLNAPPRCGQRREAGAQWWGPTRLHPGWVPEADGSVDPSTEGIHKDTDGPDQASDCIKNVAHLPGRFLVLAGFGVPAFRTGHGPHLLPGCLLPRQGHGRVPGGGAGEGDTIVGGGGDVIGAWSWASWGASCTGGCLEHRGVRWERSRRCSAQPPVLTATVGAGSARRTCPGPPAGPLSTDLNLAVLNLAVLFARFRRADRPVSAKRAVVPPVGLEPTTFGLKVRSSDQLS